MAKMRFHPLESNPESINEYLKNLGLSSNYGVSDIIGFDEELLPFALKPIYGIIFLYPSDEDGSLDRDFSCLDETPEERDRKDEELGKDLYKITQTIGNACGTIALIHAIANNLDKIEFQDKSVLKKFIDSTIDKTPDERGKLLENEKELANAHQECAENGETELIDNTLYHFVALIHHKGYLWRMNGSNNSKRATRVNIADEDTILERTGEYVKKFSQINPSIVSFSAMSLNKF